MRCLVTGGAGFIGSNLVDALLARGDEVTVVDDLSTGRRENLDGALAAGARAGRSSTSATPPRWRELAAEARPEVVFHLAAQIDVRKSVADPAFDASINVGGTANVLEAARAAGARRVVFVSTGGAIYGEGDGQELPLDEDAPIAPLSAYGQSKFAAEGYLALYERLYGLSSVAPAARQRLRPAPGPARRGGRDRDLLRQAARPAGGRPCSATAPRPATTYMWATWSRRRWPRPGSTATGPINIGTGIETDVLELVELLGELGGAEGFEPELAPPRTGEVQRISIDPARAERELGWSAEIGLEEGLRLTLDVPLTPHH